jgi:ABC-type branched-subunit amino acid transport system substrate-binding protein
MTIDAEGTNGANFPEAGIAAKAYEAAINAKGGINGRPLKVTVCNDKNDNNRAATCARQAVSDKAVAVVGSFSLGAGQILPILAPANIPYLANAAIDASEFSSPDSYPILSGPVGFLADGVLAGKDPSCTKIDVVTFDLPSAAGLTPFVSQGTAVSKKTVSLTVKIPVTTTDYSSAAASAKDAKCIVLALPDQAVQAFLAKAAAIGAKQKYFAPAGAIGAGALKNFTTQLEGSVEVSSFLAISDPAWADFKAATTAYGKTIDLGIPEGQSAWVGYVILDKVASQISGDITGASFKAALDKAAAVDTGGLTPTLDFTKHFPVAALARISNTQLVTLAVKNGAFEQDGTFVDFAGSLGG